MTVYGVSSRGNCDDWKDDAADEERERRRKEKEEKITPVNGGKENGSKEGMRS